MGNEDKIFSEDFTDKEKDNLDRGFKQDHPNKDLNIFGKQVSKEKIDVSDEVTKGLGKSKRMYGIIGILVISAIGLAVYYGVTEGLIGNSEPFDPTQCHYGIHSDIFGLRCITEEEYTKTLPSGIDISVTPSEENKGNEPLRDISKTTDMVELEKTKDILGYYMVTTEGDWYGDYVDFRKLPNKIDKTGTQKINFRCYTDEFLKTSTYFGTFRNVIENNMKVEVFINDKLVNEESTNTNNAIIVEGSCIGN